MCLHTGYWERLYGHKPLISMRFHGVFLALHQKSGQKSDAAVNRDFLASF